MCALVGTVSFDDERDNNDELRLEMIIIMKIYYLENKIN